MGLVIDNVESTIEPDTARQEPPAVQNNQKGPQPLTFDELRPELARLAVRAARLKAD